MAAWAWVPDKGEGGDDIQSRVFQEYMEVLLEGIRGKNFVYNGCVVTGGADMTPAVSAGMVISNGKKFIVAAGDVTIGNGHATLPRIDLIVVDSSGTKQVRAGTAATDPKPPARSANDVVLASVFVPINETTAIADSEITDIAVRVDYRPLFFSLQAADEHSVSTVACTKVTGMDCYLEPGTYSFLYTVRWQGAATTTGVHFAINHTGTAAVYAATLKQAESTTAASTGAASQAGYAVTNAKLISGSGARTKATTAANLGTSISNDSAGGDMLVEISGYIIVTAAGNLELWHGSEVAAATTVKEGTGLLLARAA